MHKIFVIPTGIEGAEPFTLGIASAHLAWSWTLRRKAGKTPGDDLYELYNFDEVVARFCWVDSQLAITYANSDNPVQIKVDGLPLEKSSLLSRKFTSGSLILLKKRDEIEVQTTGILAQWLGTPCQDAEVILNVDLESLPVIAAAVSVWKDWLAEDWLSPLGRAVYDRLVEVTGQKNVNGKVEDQRQLPNVQLGQTWLTRGCARHNKLLPAPQLFVIAIGELIDPPGSKRVTLGATILDEAGNEVLFVFETFRRFFAVMA